MNYEHLLIKEIKEQPKVLANTLSQYLSHALTLKISKPPFTDKTLQSIENICLIACGTSYHAGLAAKHLIEELSSIPTSVELASEIKIRKPAVNSKTLLIAISQSGQTTDTLEAFINTGTSTPLKAAIVNTVPSPIADEASGVLQTLAGLEESIASTKAFTSQLLVLNLLGIRIAQAKQCSLETCQLILNQMSNLPELVRHALSYSEQIATAAESLAKYNNVIYLARGRSSALAFEGALKMKETAYIHAEGYPSGEVKHGPLALLEENFPVIMLAYQDEYQEQNIKLLKDIKNCNAPIYLITEDTNKDLIEMADFFLPIPKVPKYLKPLVSVVPMQLLAYHCARIKGLEIDKPRHLAKAVLE